VRSVVCDVGIGGRGWPDVRFAQSTVDLGADASPTCSPFVTLGLESLTILLRLRRRSFLGAVDDAVVEVRCKGDALTASLARNSLEDG